jgi:DNA-binding MarR family transcriptional regulator
VRSVSTRQLDLLRALDVYTRREGLAPSQRDLADALCVDLKVVQAKIIGLEFRGLVSRKLGVARSLRLTDAGRALVTNG